MFDHILVAEELLGRHLVDGESVHHLNGIRDDIRLENLELWTRPQPCGIRISDASAWAREIYDRYVALGERKLAAPTCRDEVVEAVMALAVGGGEGVLTVAKVYAAVVASGTLWPRATVAKTMLRMTRPARRPPYLKLDRVGPDRYRVFGCVPGVSVPAS